MTTADIVPSCTTAVNAAPGSSQPTNAGTMRRCAVLEIGRNSVRPWTIPRTIASRALTWSEASARARRAYPATRISGRRLRLAGGGEQLVAGGELGPRAAPGGAPPHL